jgi:dihydroorotase
LIDERVGELIPGPYLDSQAALAAAVAHPEFVIGFKARLSTYAAGGGVHRVLQPLRALANQAGLPVMVHIGDTSETLDEILPFLETGDVVTHAFTSRRHGILDNHQTLLPSVRKARANGVLFDAAAGRNHLSFRVLSAALDQGFPPDIVSSDITRSLEAAGSPSLMGTLAALLALGVPIESVIQSVTNAPAKAIRRPELSTLQCGDATVLRIADVETTVRDSDGSSMTVARVLTPVGFVRKGAWHPIANPGSGS